MSHRPRYHRITAFVLSTGVTAFASLAGLGVFGDVATGSTAYAASGARGRTHDPAPAGPHADRAVTATMTQGSGYASRPSPPAGQDVALPAHSGSGRRVVFDMSAQRVWLVGGAGHVRRTYLVSGSVTDNLVPGAYAVYSRSRWAVGVDDSGVMQYFVRFTRGNNAAIGFHDIPEHNGRPLQTPAQLGTPRSHGCIRQARPDAIALWDFSPVGTDVDVVA